jgi:hypothetical protein
MHLPILFPKPTAASDGDAVAPADAGRKVGEDTFGILLDGPWLSKEHSLHSLFVPTFWQWPRNLGRLGSL